MKAYKRETRGKPERTEANVGIRRYLLWVWMVVDLPHSHDHYVCTVLYHDARPQRLHNVRAIFRHRWRLILEGTPRVGK